MQHDKAIFVDDTDGEALTSDVVYFAHGRLALRLVTEDGKKHLFALNRATTRQLREELAESDV